MGVVVDTVSGKLKGERRGGHERFLGIPFAAAPVGERRWRAPQPAPLWSRTRPALAFGASAPQPPSALPGMAVGPQDEDCLYLNVFTPRADGARRPVLFWIHGGGFTTGGAAQAMYDGGRLAERGDVVVVTINYRLGSLGYLHLPGCDANLGQLDQIAALEWTRDNIRAFGGDPDQVTIFGESAGGMAVATLLGMPGARGLFRGAIAQSGAAQNVHTRASAAEVTAAVLAELGQSVPELAKLRELPVSALIEAQKKVTAARRAELELAFCPTVDPATLPKPPLDAVREGAASGVALLVGSNRDEIKLFRLGVAESASLSPESLLKRVRGTLGAVRADPARAEALVDTYRAARAGRASVEPGELLDAIQSDRTFRIPAIRLAEAQRRNEARTYMYFFTWESPARRGTLGACHALELPFVFGTLDAPTMDRFAGKGPEADALSAQMMDAWIAFARAGEPTHGGVSHWPAYDTRTRATLVFDRECQLVHAPLDAERAAWEGIL
ncbi:MAG TPA: carboxylesterase/lipase family protein [Myxococcota bacterium]|nr:carboxylesterase/lipase family protein [Myxococcota bacterium]